MRALIISPTPPFPIDAGNRRRIVDFSQMLKESGFTLDFAYYALEDKIYEQSGQSPSTSFDEEQQLFDRYFYIQLQNDLRLKTRASFFFKDDWFQDVLRRFIVEYFNENSNTALVVVNYVFLASVLDYIPDHVTTMIDTHDRFGSRNKLYRSVRAEPNFFSMRDEDEILYLNKADYVVAIQSREEKYFKSALHNSVLRFGQPLSVAEGKREQLEDPVRWGFIGHENDVNVISLRKFLYEAQRINENLFSMVSIVVAGSVCKHVQEFSDKITLLGYVPSVADFYNCVDGIIAPLLFGTGLKVKIVEAMGLSVPILGTRFAFDGIPTSSPYHSLKGVENFISVLSSMSNEIYDKICQDTVEAKRNYISQYENDERDLKNILLSISSGK